MSVFDDPTPCPLPRHGILKHPRYSLGPEPSVTLPDAPRVGLRDARPRRPRKRQSIGWDPTVDIFDDAAVEKLPTVTETQQPVASTENSNMRVEATKAPRRKSTLFAQPAQRVSSQVGTGNSAVSPRKRRLSSVSETRGHQQEPIKHEKSAPEQSILRKEARRRTIYMPNDTTVLTIHPGASLKGQPDSRVHKPRKSDVFLDLATVTGDRIGTDRAIAPVDKAISVKRTSGQSLSAAPRRAPLQASQKQFQSQASVTDIPGQGPGKENVPPGGALGANRLGKRASLIIPEKPFCREKPALASVGEDSELKIEEAPPVMDARPSSGPSNTLADELQKPASVLSRQSLSAAGGSRRLSHSQSLVNTRSSIRRSSIFNSASIKQSLKPPEQAPKSLSVPNISISNNRPSSSTPTYAPLSEDIAHPELYEENWLSHQEQAITQLANSLFDKASGSDGPLDAKSTMRQNLLSMYHSSESVLLHKRLQASLRFGALCIPQETLHQVVRFRDDCGQRRRFLDLWMKTYDLEALQIAAEVVVGRRRVSTPRSSASNNSSPKRDPAKSTAKFLQTFLIQNQDLSNRQSVALSGPASPNGVGATSGTQLWRRTAIRSLMMIQLLDTAQRSGMFAGRNLFQKASPYKSSLSVLQGLCRLLIPSVGDAARALAHLGYTVEHAQYPLEEFTYNINNLAVDLRDGIRLTRLVECLLYPPGSLDLQKDGLTLTLASGDIVTSKVEYNNYQGTTWPLSQHLKYPCLGRPQRVFNVEVALAALSSVEDFREGLLRDISAADIVDGHREKSVRLLWGLVSRWGLSMLVDLKFLDYETKRLKSLRLRGKNQDITNDGEDAELPYLSDSQRNERMLKEWAANVGLEFGTEVTNLTTSFANGQAYRGIGLEYASIITTSNKQEGASASNTSLSSTLSSLGCSKSFVELFITTSNCPSKTTTISLLAFLASRILPVAAPYNAAISIQRAYRVHRARWETKRRVVLKCLATECAEVVVAQKRLVSAVQTLQTWWRDCVKQRREGTRRWI